MNLIFNLFHYKCGSYEYGVEAVKYGHKPLYVKTAGGAENTMLNKVFCYIVIFRTSGCKALRLKIHGGG